jgi:hypothetical protein
MTLETFLMILASLKSPGARAGHFKIFPFRPGPEGTQVVANILDRLPRYGCLSRCLVRETEGLEEVRDRNI